MQVYPSAYRTTAYPSHRGHNLPVFTKMKVPYMANLTPFLEQNPVIAIVLMLIMLRFIRVLCNRLLEKNSKKQ